MKLDWLKSQLDKLRAEASRSPVSSALVFALTDPIMDEIARKPTTHPCCGYQITEGHNGSCTFFGEAPSGIFAKILEPFAPQGNKVPEKGNSFPENKHASFVDPRDPRPGVTGIFRNHNCAYCDSGKKPCRQGNPNQCDNPHARND